MNPNHPQLSEVGRGRGRMGQDRNEQLRRPNASDEALVRGMANMQPYNNAGGYGMAQPAPNASGWSSGVNQGEGNYGGGRGYYPGPGGGGHNQYNQGYGQGQAPGQQQQRFSAQERLERSRMASNLNVCASGFVPKSNLSASANEFVPRSCARNTSQWAQVPATVYYGDPSEELDSAIATLSFSPGKFDHIAAHLTDVLNTAIADLPTMQAVVTRIFDACLNESNFRYTGARLLDHLSSCVLIDIDGQTFRTVLLKKCQAMKISSETDLISSDPALFHSFTIFLADLFLHLGVYPQGSYKHRIAVLGTAVVDLLLALATQKPITKENLKTISQTLKMAGHALEEEEKNNNSGQCPKLEQLMQEVEILSKTESPDIPSYMFQMMTQLLDLRKNVWGVSQEAPVVTAPPAASQKNDGAQKKYVISEGKKNVQQFDPAQMSAEEIAFIRENCGGDFGIPGDFEEDEGEEYGENNGEMPPEIEAAFEEFITSQRAGNS